MPILDHFNLLAPVYERAMRVRHPERMVKVARLPVDGVLLDAGGGTGRVSAALTAYTQHVIVADASLGMLRQTANHNGLRAACAIAEKLPFAEAAFARVIMVDALHHVYNAAATTAELWRVLKPGGRLVIEEPDIHSPLVKIVAVVEKLALMRSHFISPQKIAALFSYSNAQVTVERDGYTSWVIVDKM